MGYKKDDDGISKYKFPTPPFDSLLTNTKTVGTGFKKYTKGLNQLVPDTGKVDVYGKT